MRISDWSSDVCSSDLLESLRSQDLEVHVLFLRADDSILLQRYSETRRRHPLAQGDIGLSEAIRIERQLQIGRASCRERVCPVRVDIGGRRIINKKTQNDK